MAKITATKISKKEKLFGEEKKAPKRKYTRRAKAVETATVASAPDTFPMTIHVSRAWLAEQLANRFTDRARA